MGGNREDDNRRVLEAFLGKPGVSILRIDESAAARYAGLRHALKGLGKPIPTNDLWIAAQALDSGAILLSNDSRFDPIIGLQRLSF